MPLSFFRYKKGPDLILPLPPAFPHLPVYYLQQRPLSEHQVYVLKLVFGNLWKKAPLQKLLFLFQLGSSDVNEAIGAILNLLLLLLLLLLFTKSTKRIQVNKNKKDSIFIGIKTFQRIKFACLTFCAFLCFSCFLCFLCT